MTTLFDELKIGSMKLKNCTFMAPMSLGYGDQTGIPTLQEQAYWLERAKGEVGCIITDATSVDPNTPYLGNTLCFRSEESIVEYKKFTDKIHEYGTKIIPQITHPGPESISSFFGVTPISSSGYLNSMYQQTRELKVEEIPNIISMYANTSYQAKQAGFDGIELHCAHGYMLLGSFLSPLKNKRTDEYGGDLMHRARLLFEVIEAIKSKCGSEFPIILRMSGSEKIAGGNTVVFNPHPAAIKTSIYAINLLNEASLESGGPDNIAVTVEKPTLETSNVMMKHKDIPLIAATGGPGVVTAVLSSGKRGIGAGAGNPPALVDETADIRKAATDIVNGCTFDNNLPCIAEKEIVAVSSIVDELMHYLVTENDCYLASKEEQDKLTEVVLAGGKLNRKCVGRDARTLLSMIGVNAPANIRCIVFEGPKEHPLITTELMMPILGVVRARDFDDAVEQAVWLEHGNRHSAHIHSKNIDNITKYAKAIDTAILVKNAPSYAALGFGGEGYCTFTIASRTGEGLTCASTFTKRRRCVMADSLCIR